MLISVTPEKLCSSSRVLQRDMHIGHTWFGSTIWRVIIQSTNTLDHLKAVEQARTNFNSSGSHNYTAERLFRKVAGKKMQASVKQ